MIDNSIIHSNDGKLLGVLLHYCLNSANLFVVNGGDKLSCIGIGLGKLFSSCNSLSISCEDCCLAILVDLLDGLGRFDDLSNFGIVNNLGLLSLRVVEGKYP